MADEMSAYTAGMIEGQNKNCGGYGGYGMGMDGFGGGWIWPLLLFGLLFGGGFGFGGFGGGRGNFATPEDVRAAVDQQTLISKLDQQTYGLADTFTALNNTLNNNFRGIDNAVCSLGYNVQGGFNQLGHQISDCCCQTQRAIDGVKYDMASQFCNLGNTINMQTRDIIDNQNANYRGLMDFLVQEKLSSKDAQIVQLQNQLSRSDQNAVIGARIDAAVAEVLRRTGNDCPTAAYLVQPPTPVNFPTNGCGQVQFSGYGNGCGCGCAA